MPTTDLPAGYAWLLATCKACGTDLSRLALVGQLLLPVLEQTQGFDPRHGLVPGPLQVRMAVQVVKLVPMRCPECGHPAMAVKSQQVLGGTS